MTPELVLVIFMSLVGGAIPLAVWLGDRLDREHGPEREWRREDLHARQGGDWWQVRRG